MKLSFFATLVAATSLSVAAPAVSQSGWRGMNERQAEIDQRIDQGVQNGALTQQERLQLRSEFRAIAGLEADYRRTGGGLNASERADLERRMDQLSRRVHVQKSDRQGANGGWWSVNQRQAELDARIDQGVRNGALTRQERDRLRSDFRALAVLETDYRRSGGGLNSSERADLESRFDQLSRRVYVQKTDRQTR